MKKLLLLLFICVSTTNVFGQATTDTNSQQTTTYYLVRHAEKDLSNPSERNPELTKIGHERAESWSAILGTIKFDAVYSTNFKRTFDTAIPTANKNNLEVEIYGVRNFDLEIFKSATKGKNVLIVGHSNTIPFLANDIIGEQAYQQIDDKDYSNLFIITIAGDTVSHSLLKIN